MPPSILIIFGATGDLTRRKLMPALFRLHRAKVLGTDLQIVGLARRQYSDQEFREEMKQAVKQHEPSLAEKDWQNFGSSLRYQQGRFEDLVAFTKLAELLSPFTQSCKLFYLATPPKYYQTILTNLQAAKLSAERKVGGLTRIIIEKPFGKDLATARDLDRQLMEIFSESQIYRIDHYLGKETVQNMLAFRFANGIFEPIWNSLYVDHVQITMAETEGVGSRGAFYEGVGALRDVAQNHLLMMLSLVAMEQPVRFASEEVRDARAQLVKAIECLEEGDVLRSTVRGQYDRYRQEKDVDPRSFTETYAAIRLFIGNDRWRGVPWYLRTGKRLPKEAVEISLVFRQVCHILFKDVGCPEEPNVLTIRIGPKEGFSIRLISKKPGSKFLLKSVNMDLSYSEEGEHADAYERLLEDVFRGEQMLFNRSDELEATWEIITKILNSWEKLPPPAFPNYAAGSWGPKEAEELIAKDGRKWILI